MLVGEKLLHHRVLGLEVGSIHDADIIYSAVSTALREICNKIIMNLLVTGHKSQVTSRHKVR